MSAHPRSSRVLAALALLLVLSASVAGPVLGQSAPNGTGPGADTANGTSPANGTNTTAGPVNTTALGNETGNGTAINATNATNATVVTNGSNGSGGGGGFGFGIPSTEEVAGEAVNGTLSTLNRVFVDTVGTILRLPWQFITLRFAPFEAAASVGDGGLWTRPPGVFGELYDLAVGRAFEIATFVLAVFFLIDWLGNFSPNPRTMGVGDRLFRRGGDTAHLLFSWPIAWAHFLFASLLCALFLPPDEVVVSGLTDYYSQLVGVAAAVGFTLVFSVVLAVAGGYLLLKHAAAFVYLLVGLVAYPILVAGGIPDHPVVGRLGEYAENAREGYVVSAWYPVPTAFVIGVGYTIDGAVLNALTLGGPLGQVGGGAIYYPVLWLAALYAPEKVFKDGSVARQAKTAALAVGAGGAAGAATGSAAGASSGAAAGASAGGSAGGASSLAAGSTAGALPPGTGSAAAGGAATSTAGTTTARMTSGSPGASALADGGTGTVADSSSSAGGATFGSLGSQAGGSASASSNVGASAGAGGDVGTDRVPPDGLTHVADRSSLDTTQRYEPLVQHDSGNLAGVEAPRDANWLADRGGFDRLDEAMDEPIYFKGESDGRLYDLRGAADSGGVHEYGTSSGDGDANSIRDI